MLLSGHFAANNEPRVKSLGSVLLLLSGRRQNGLEVRCYVDAYARLREGTLHMKVRSGGANAPLIETSDTNHYSLSAYHFLSRAAWAAASRATGIRKGLQLT